MIDVSMKELNLLTTKELQSIWQKIFQTPVPKGYTKSFLIKEIQFYEKYRDLPNTLKQSIDKLIKQYTKGKVVNTKKLKRFKLAVGTKLIREFKGEKYEVIAVENGYIYAGEKYNTLSAIANVITGTHWNGKKFFGVANG